MSLRVLLIEDDPPSAELAAYLLRMAGHSVTDAPDGPRGLALARSQAFDVILCDLHLPGLDGLAIAEALRSDGRGAGGPRLVALTASTMVGDAERAYASGFDAYLSKPITPETFVAEVMALAAK